MKTIVIYAHPETDGFSSTMLEKVEFLLKERDLDYEVWDLYKMNYSPVLKKEELYTAGNRYISPENLNFQEKIKQAKNVVFIYPVWWGGMPAF